MKLSKEEFYSKYGNVEFTFSSYYKFSFVFVGNSNNYEIIVSVGGSADDIYKFEVISNEKYKLGSLDISWGEVKLGSNIVESCYCASW